RNRSGIVLHHREAKCDHEKQTREASKVESFPAFGARQSGLHSKPHNKDGGEPAKQILAHANEQIEVRCHQSPDAVFNGSERILNWDKHDNLSLICQLAFADGLAWNW